METDPDYPVPEGFTKRVEKTVKYTYGVPDYLPVSESHQMAFDILDEIFF